MTNVVKFSLAAVVVAFAFSFAAIASAVSASAIYTPSSGYLMVGSGMGAKAYQASNVVAAQTALNACVPGTALVLDGKFGPLTKGKFMAFQASKNIQVDGIIGPVTAAQLAACSGNQPTTPGGSNDNGSSGSLSGGAGSIDNVDQTSSDVEDEVLEGDEDVKVLGFDVEADGSDLAISSLRVTFEHTSGTGSDRFDHYADSVSVWFEGDMVGSADVDDFSEDNDVYSENISLDDVVVEENEEGRFYVAVSAASNIDSNDFAAVWTVEATQIRYEDATGAMFSETGSGLPVSETFNYEDLASSGDLELKLSKGSDNPDAQAVEVDDSSDTDVSMLEFKLKAEGSDMTIDSLVMDIASSGANIDVIADEFKLMLGDDEIDSVNVADLTSAGAGTSDTVEFTDLDDDLDLEDGDTVTLSVVATINEIDGVNFVNGDQLKVSFTGSNLDDVAGGETTDVEDSNGDAVAAGDRTGSANGEIQSFFVDGILVTDVQTSTSYISTADDLNEASVGKFVITFKAQAFGSDIYLDKSTDSSGTAGTAGEGIVYTITSSATPDSTTAVFECTSNCQDTSDNTSDAFFIADGDTETYRLTVTITGDATTPTPADFKVWMDSINWDTDGTTDTTADYFYSSDLGEDSDADTGYLFLNAL